MHIIFHADDFGLTKGITDSILRSVDEGVIARTSIIPNGYAFDYAIEEFKKRPGLELSVHLNLLEGKPCVEPAGKSVLLDANGFLHHSFQSLWFEYHTGGKELRALLRRQVSAEIEGQLRKVALALGPNAPLTVDSHQHLHMIPFVFDELVKLAGKFTFKAIRVPRERFFLNLGDRGSIRNYLGMNIAKQIVLNGLSRRNLPKLQTAGIGSNDHFVGVLFTGRMSARAAEKALARIPEVGGKTVEVLFHPGEASEEEHRYWQRYPQLWSYYRSEDRAFERAQASHPRLDALRRQVRPEHRRAAETH